MVAMPVGTCGRVDLVDARTGTVLCPIKPLDKAANANGQRLLRPTSICID